VFLQFVWKKTFKIPQLQYIFVLIFCVLQVKKNSHKKIKRQKIEKLNTNNSKTSS